MNNIKESYKNLKQELEHSIKTSENMLGKLYDLKQALREGDTEQIENFLDSMIKKGEQSIQRDEKHLEAIEKVYEIYKNISGEKE